nr:protein phosphatase 1 regulatory subunit 42-like [Penaeus vannamei]
MVDRLEGLKELPSLRRLLVGGNRVGVVEGLPHGLQELHIQEQRLPPGDALVLDPHALAAVQDTLLLLDVSGNRMTELGPVGLLNNLKVLRAGDNDLRTLSHLTAVIGRLRHLQEAHFVGNPVTAHRRYRPALILASQPKLENLDGRDVSSYSRDFLVQANRHRQALRQEKEARPPSPPEASQEAVKPDAHLLFTSASHSANASECATGPMFVLGALRRPEFDLILSRAQRRAKALEREAAATSPGSELEGLDEDRFFASNGGAPEGGRRGDEDDDAHWSGGSRARGGAPLEKNVWFPAGDASPPEELPRLVPRPYWRNKPPAPRVHFPGKSKYKKIAGCIHRKYKKLTLEV